MRGSPVIRFLSPRRTSAAGLVALLWSTAAAAALVANDDATVTDTVTGLIWDRCPWGQAWDGDTCTGSPARLIWADALAVSVIADGDAYRGARGWRLPNVTELDSIVSLANDAPVIDTERFPATPAEGFWTSTPYNANPSSAVLAMDFSTAEEIPVDKTALLPFRLVRSAAFDGFPLLNQSLSGTPPVGLRLDGEAILEVSASSGLPVVLQSAAAGVCTVSGDRVAGVAVGACVLVATQSGNVDYAAADPLELRFAVERRSQTIDFPIPASPEIGASVPLLAAASSGLPVTFQSLTESVCTVSGGRIIGASAGTCTVMASQAGDTDNAPAQARVDFAVLRHSQTIGFGALPQLVVGGSGALSATASSGLVVSFSSLTPAVCAVNGDSVQGLAAGTCTVAAEQAGNADYNPAPRATLEIGVGKGEQSISFVVAPELAVGGTASLSASASSGLAVSFSSLTPAVCAVSGDSVQGLTVGDCIVAADQAGSADYDPAPRAIQEIVVGKGSQTITFEVVPRLVVGSAVGLSASASSGLTAEFSSLTPMICAVNGSGVQGLAEGTCTIAADQAGDADYHPAPRVSRDIQIEPLPTQVSGDVGTGTITASVQGGGDLCGFSAYQFRDMSQATAPPAGVNFPHGLFDFTLSNCPGTAILTLVYPADLPPGSDYWKYGPTTPGGASEWYVMPGAQVSGDTVTFSLTDGELGDDDWSANGEIVDAGGPGQALRAGARPVPVLSGWAVILLTLLLTLSGIAVVARRAGE